MLMLFNLATFLLALTFFNELGSDLEPYSWKQFCIRIWQACADIWIWSQLCHTAQNPLHAFSLLAFIFLIF